jgi:hypothetical protein
MDPTTTSYESARRGTRIRAQLPLRVTSLDPTLQFSEHCQTLVVNPLGCGVRLSRPLEPGLPVQLDNLPTGQVVAARVANCVPLGAGAKFWLVGIALEQPGNVWGIQPVPADWGVEPVVVAAAPAAPPTKKDEWPYSQFSSKGEFHPGRR